MPYKAFLIPAIGVIVIAFGYILFGGLDDNLVYYLTPTEAIEQRPDYADGERFRLGGLVADGSILETETGVTFAIVDDGHVVNVRHTGTPPQLFQDNVGVVVEGAWAGEWLATDTLIIRHDEEYRSTDDQAPYVPPSESSRSESS